LFADLRFVAAGCDRYQAQCVILGFRRETSMARHTICFHRCPDIVFSQAAPQKGAALGEGGKDRWAKVEETRPRIKMLSAQAAAAHPVLDRTRRLGTNEKRDQPRYGAAFQPEGGIIFSLAEQ
jgi:hypothetical protein